MVNRIVLESLEATRKLLLDQQTELAKRLREIEKLMPKKREKEDYTIIKQKRQKTGFVYCARYYVNGKVLPTKYSLKTTDYETAKTRAESWKDSFLNSYGTQERRGCAFHNLLSGYYADGSKYLAESLSTKRQISKKLIQRYHNFINNTFIPFLKEEGITKIESLKPEKLLKFGGRLREDKKLTAKTINNYINGAVKQAFDFLYLKERIRYNPFRDIAKGGVSIKAQKGEVKRRRIYPINRLFDVLVYSQLWVLHKEPTGESKRTNEPIRYKKYLFCLIAATTGLRRGEVFMLKKSSIEEIHGVYFLNIDNSRADLENPGVKTENSYRRVPLHKFVYNATQEYIENEKITGDYLFYRGNKTQDSRAFIEAYIECGIHCGYSEEEIQENNVDFHSFRHFYQTILSQENIPIHIIKSFMGHSKNMNDMSERYSHIEEIGNDIGDVDLLIENADKVLDVTDKHINNAKIRHIGEGINQSVFIEPKQVELTTQRKTKIKYWTYTIIGYEGFITLKEEQNT